MTGSHDSSVVTLYTVSLARPKSRILSSLRGREMEREKAKEGVFPNFFNFSTKKKRPCHIYLSRVLEGGGQNPWRVLVQASIIPERRLSSTFQDANEKNVFLMPVATVEPSSIGCRAPNVLAVINLVGR